MYDRIREELQEREMNRMEITLKDIIGLTKELPEEYFKEAFEKLREIKDKAESEQETSSQMKVCPRCQSVSVVRNGKRNGRQSYICRDCGKAFVQSTGSAIANSHSSEIVWKEVIRDTVSGISLDKTANSLDLHHSTVFNMRHKILNRIEHIIFSFPVTLNGVCELDETYVLESVKGRKIP
jgi:transposase-like protein